MDPVLTSPAHSFFLFIPAALIYLLIPLLGIGTFTFIIARRSAPLIRSKPDFRWNRFFERGVYTIKYWLMQYKQPRYRLAGVLHILLFAGFLILGIRSISLVILGFYDGFVFPGLDGWIGHVYSVLKDYMATIVFVVVVVAAIRRLFFMPARYRVPEKYGKDHTAEAILVLGFIAILMASESLFEASQAAAQAQAGAAAEFIAPLSLPWFFKIALLWTPLESLQSIHLVSYFIHDVTFFLFLCFLPMGKHFHVVTSLFNVFFMKLNKGSVKPVQWGVSDEQLDDLESFGVKNFEDFTWKHILDFYSCADCGRCSDNCPANAAGRPLSPRFISIKGRDYCFKHYPLRGDFVSHEPLMEGTYEDDEIWSCTTCGACEEECPLMIEYIDKIVDLRRGMVDEGNVPQSLQKPLRALEKRGNPYGKMEKKRADWIKGDGFPEDLQVTILGKKETADTLYFVDSVTSYDDRIQEIGRATARVLFAAGEDFGILGRQEKDSGHEVRRFGEEMLFQALRDENTDAIRNSGVRRIVTADPHAFNALIKDYEDLPRVEHISQVMARAIARGKLNLKAVENPELIYTYHDPCYLGRHNNLYDTPRDVIDAIPGLRRVEMDRCRDRSFCCGGGGLMLFYEPVEETRMGKLRVEMAKAAGADVIVTACPFCMVNIEDAIKTSGLEGQMVAMDLSELIAAHLNG
ncbi:Fe-S oxidoreductase [Olavius algarvensis associated proteobacterium Delta 3]|nr:Fe-S oxidoreductase [Olavius algarvensis associated proteobacterium Delta 3]CAB5117132.1 Fe-S oxidoreductase [Olavius algarvensis associated proteobacterium Delta 3]